MYYYIHYFILLVYYWIFDIFWLGFSNILINLWFQEIGSNTVFSNQPVIDYGDVLILSVKPQVVPKVLPELKNYKKLLLSIAMGIPLASLEKVNNLIFLLVYILIYKLLYYHNYFLYDFNFSIKILFLLYILELQISSWNSIYFLEIFL